jgi:TRAP-type C4-dicarboxylate transport system permease small subunit
MNGCRITPSPNRCRYRISESDAGGAPGPAGLCAAGPDAETTRIFLARSLFLRKGGSGLETLDMHKDRRIVLLTKFCNFFREGAMWILLALVFIIIVNIIMRRVFNAPIFGVVEVIKYVMLVCAALSLPENEWVEGNISMKLIPEKMTEGGRARLFAIMNFCAGGMCGYATFLMFEQMYVRFFNHTSTPELGIPMWAPELILVIGMGLLSIAILAKAVLWVWMSVHHQYIDYVQLGLRQLRDIAVTESDEVELLAEKGR